MSIPLSTILWPSIFHVGQRPAKMCSPVLFPYWSHRSAEISQPEHITSHADHLPNRMLRSLLKSELEPTLRRLDGLLASLNRLWAVCLVQCCFLPLTSYLRCEVKYIICIHASSVAVVALGIWMVSIWLWRLWGLMKGDWGDSIEPSITVLFFAMNKIQPILPSCWFRYLLQRPWNIGFSTTVELHVYTYLSARGPASSAVMQAVLEGSSPCISGPGGKLHCSLHMNSWKSLQVKCVPLSPEPGPWVVQGYCWSA